MNITHLTSRQADWYLNIHTSFIKDALIEQRNIQLSAAKIWCFLHVTANTIKNTQNAVHKS
jgi:hypothetical protein